MTDLKTRAAEFTWFHSMDLGHGVVTEGIKPSAMLAVEADAIFGPVEIAGRTVLDIGAWNGFFSFEAKRRGAGRVVATDSYCWTSPRFHGREAFDLARESLGFEVEAQEIDVANLDPNRMGRFDVVLFLGVFYHRYDAIEALTKVAALAKHLLIVETHLDLQDVHRPAMVFYPGAELAGDATNWWGPNARCVEELLRGHGFAVDSTAHPTLGDRGIFHAWRTTELRRTPPRAVAAAKPDAQPKPAPLSIPAKIMRELRRPFRRRPRP